MAYEWIFEHNGPSLIFSRLGHLSLRCKLNTTFNAQNGYSNMYSAPHIMQNIGLDWLENFRLLQNNQVTICSCKVT